MSMSGSKRKASSEAETVEEVPAATGGEDQPLPGNLREDLLSRLRNDPHLCDITLVGSDGGRVQATRAILAMRSRVFERMLMGEFKEGGCNEMQMAYSAVVLGHVVEYCYSDEVQCFDHFIHFIKTDEENAKPEEDIKMIRAMVTVVAAADFFELKGLYSYVENGLLKLIRGAPDRKCFNACAIWDESLKYAPLTRLQARALNTIEQSPKLELLSDAHGVTGVAVLCPESLLRLVEDDVFLVYAEILFEAILVWSKVEDQNIQQEERMEVARQCASKIELRFIPSKLILDRVAESGLVDPARLIEVLKEQQRRKSVYVHRAGTPAVNGWYKENETKINGRTAYVKCGTTRLDGEMVSVYIYSRSDGATHGYYKWFVSAPPIGGEVTGTKADRAFYVSIDFNLSTQHVLPVENCSSASRWTSGALGFKPSPQLMVTKSLTSSYPTLSL